MKIIVTAEDGKRAEYTVNDQNMTALLGRLNGPNKWIDANGDGKLLLNFDRVIKIQETPAPPE